MVESIIKTAQNNWQKIMQQGLQGLNPFSLSVTFLIILREPLVFISSVILRSYDPLDNLNREEIQMHGQTFVNYVTDLRNTNF